MRTPERGLPLLRDALGTGSDDRRLAAVRLDLEDTDSIVAAAADVVATFGAPDAVVHNAGMAAVGVVEDLPDEVWKQVFQTNLFGPVRLTRQLLPSMRAAGVGRVVILSSQGGVRGAATAAAYAGAKAAVDRWAEALAGEIAPFGLGVTLLVPGAFKTDILEETIAYTDREGPYGRMSADLEIRGRRMLRFAVSPERFPPAVERALHETAPFARHAVGRDAKLLLHGSRLVPARLMHRLLGEAMGLPKAGSLRTTPPEADPPAASGDVPDGRSSRSSSGNGTTTFPRAGESPRP